MASTARTLLPIDTDVCSALEHPLRATILDLLGDEPMHVEELTEALADRGHDKAPTTVRHHLDVLKDAGLVELDAVEARGGAALKYYRSNTRLLGYELTEDQAARLEDAERAMLGDLTDALETVLADHGDAIREVADDLKPCPYCSRPHFTEFVLLKLIERAASEAVPEVVG